MSGEEVLRASITIPSFFKESVARKAIYYHTTAV
jgi:hypothetical protein